MQSINFNTGYKTYALNGDENNVIRVNVTDLNIAKRFIDTQKTIGEIIDRFMNIEHPTPADLYNADQQVREQLNYALGSDVSTAAFGTANCLSPTVSGKILIEEFMDVFMPVVTRDIQSAAAASRIKLEQKTDKYIKPITTSAAQNLPQPAPVIRVPEAKPSSFDLSSLTQEQKDALLKELLNK